MSTEAIVSAIKESGEARAPLRIAGRGTWLDAGRPVRAEKTLSLADDSGVVSYVPGDLTLTVRAGTPLSEIERITREHDQWLPLDPYGSADGTIGATIATASAGPLASSFGLARDLVLGLEFVNGRGETIRGGGKVVKNVAGFDLSRLLTGSWGTLGVVTEITLRLYAMPKVDRSFAIRLVGDEKQVASVVHALVSSPLTPYALLLLNRTTAQALGLGERPTCLIRFGGNETVVRTQVNALSQIVRPEEVESDKWTELRGLEDGAHTAVRVSSLPANVSALCGQFLVGELADFPAVKTYIDPRRGVLRVLVGDAKEVYGPTSSMDFRIGSTNSSTQVVYEKLPANVWPEISPTAVADPLSQGIKKAYDPYDILNPGILGDLT